MLNEPVNILATLVKNYSDNTEPLVKTYDLHICLCIAVMVFGEVYKFFLKGQFIYAYNICFMASLASLTLTRWLTSVFETAGVFRRGGTRL